MTLEATLAAARRRAEQFMTDTVTIRYATGETPIDEATGRRSPVYTDRFTSKCKIQATNLQARSAEVGGRTATSVRSELHLPIDAPAVEVDDIAEITAVGSLSDVQLLGRKFRIVAPVGKSFATARRLEIEEVVS